MLCKFLSYFTDKCVTYNQTKLCPKHSIDVCSSRRMKEAGQAICLETNDETGPLLIRPTLELCFLEQSKATVTSEWVTMGELLRDRVGHTHLYSWASLSVNVNVNASVNIHYIVGYFFFFSFAGVTLQLSRWNLWLIVGYEFVFKFRETCSWPSTFRYHIELNRSELNWTELNCGREQTQSLV